MKDVIKVAFVAAIAVVCGASFLNSQKSEVLSDIALANVEALADKTPVINCPGGRHLCAWITDPLGSVTFYDRNGDDSI